MPAADLLCDMDVRRSHDRLLVVVYCCCSITSFLAAGAIINFLRRSNEEKEPEKGQAQAAEPEPEPEPEPELEDDL